MRRWQQSFETRRMAARRRGHVVLETLLVMPILITLLGAGVILGLLLLGEQKVDEASGLAARVGSVGGSDEDIRAAVRKVLGETWSLQATVCISRTETTADGTPIIVVQVRLKGAAVVPSIRVLGVNPAVVTLVGQTVMRIE